jgi:hypothetical protein
MNKSKQTNQVNWNLNQKYNNTWSIKSFLNKTKRGKWMFTSSINYEKYKNNQ